MKTIKYLLMIVVVTLFASLAVKAEAHNGRLASDGCNKNNSVGNRHSHLEGSRVVDAICIKENGTNYKIPLSYMERDTIEEMCPTEREKYEMERANRYGSWEK